MTDAISTTLEAQPGITRADSWPTGTNNDGPEEYGITYDDAKTTKSAVLDALERALIETDAPGFHLDATTDPDESEYDLIISVHYHPLSRPLSDFFASHDSITAYGLDWAPEDVWDCYDDTPRLALIAPGSLDAWFEVEDDNYDAVLDDLEARLPDWTRAYNAHITLEVHAADSDHCHIGLTYDADADLAAILDAYGLSPSPVTDDAGQKTADVYTADWLPEDIFITRDGTAHVGDTYPANRKYESGDVAAFREMVALHYAEHAEPHATRDRDELTRAVSDALTSHDGIIKADGWLCGADEPGENAYGITYDSDALSRDEVLALVESLVEERDEDADHFPATVRDYTERYADETYDIVVGVTFQLS